MLSAITQLKHDLKGSSQQEINKVASELEEKLKYLGPKQVQNKDYVNQIKCSVIIENRKRKAKKRRHFFF